MWCCRLPIERKACAGRKLATALTQPSMPDSTHNCHQVFKKGLEYIFEALLLEVEADGDSQEQKDYDHHRYSFLSFLDLDENPTHFDALEDWLKARKKGQVPDDKDNIIQKKWDVIETRAKRVEQSKWDKSTQEVINHLVQQRIARRDKAAQKFYDAFLLLKSKFEYAVGEEKEALIKTVAEEIRTCLQQEISRAAKQEPVLPLSDFYGKCLHNFLQQSDFLQFSDLFAPLEVKSVPPKMQDAKEVALFADLILSLDKPAIRPSSFIPVLGLFTNKNHANACIKWLNHLEGKDLISLCQYTDSKGDTLLHCLPTEEVIKTLINRLRSSDKFITILMMKNTLDGSSVAERLFLKFPELFNSAISLLNSESLFELCQQYNFKSGVSWGLSLLRKLFPNWAVLMN